MLATAHECNLSHPTTMLQQLSFVMCMCAIIWALGSVAAVHTGVTLQLLTKG